MTIVDIAFVGGGFRTTTFLASAPDLVDHLGTTVFERGHKLGPSGFDTYTISSTSAGSRFFNHVSRQRFGEILSDPRVAKTAFSAEPVALPTLVTALAMLGSAVSEVLGDRLRLGYQVDRVEVESKNKGATLILDDQTCIRVGHAVLATGRVERPHPALDRWTDKTWRSGDVISARYRDSLLAALADADGNDLVIAGCSHSAMSALGVVLDVRSRLRQEHSDYCGPTITVLRRSPTRLMYESLDAACAGQVPGRERLARPSSDVCPDTGIVYRDSGLRHESRALFCDLWADHIDGAHVKDVADLIEQAPLFDRASLVIQALGYHGSAPDIVLDGQLVRSSQSCQRLVAKDDGAAVIDGRPHPSLSFLRVEPTPTELRDHAAYGAKLYTRLADRLRNGILATDATHGNWRG